MLVRCERLCCAHLPAQMLDSNERNVLVRERRVKRMNVWMPACLK